MSPTHKENARVQITIAHSYLNEAARSLATEEISAADEEIRKAINALSKSRGELIMHRSKRNENSDQ